MNKFTYLVAGNLTATNQNYGCVMSLDRSFRQLNWISFAMGTASAIFTAVHWMQGGLVARMVSVALAVTSSEKSSINIIESPLRAFQWAYDDYRTLPVSPPSPKRRLKTKLFSV